MQNKELLQKSQAEIEQHKKQLQSTKTEVEQHKKQLQSEQCRFNAELEKVLNIIKQVVTFL